MTDETKSKQATMQQVADLAGVSMMTVSRVLGNAGNVREATRDKVLKAMKSLHYQPNISARSLAGSRSYILGLLYENPSAGYVSQLLFGALSTCNANGYNLIVSSFRDTAEESRKAIQTLIKRSRPDGIILPPPFSDSENVLSALNEAGIPMVRIAPKTALDLSPYVCMDDFQAAYEITEYLLAKGHRKVAFIKGHPDHGASKLRYDGFRKALKDHGIEFREEYIRQGYFSFKSGFTCAEALLRLPSPPTAVFASNDDMAAGVVSAAHKFQLTVPEDISVTGFDDTPLASTIWPQLTTIQQPIIQLAEMAVSILIDPKQGERPKRDNRHVLDYRLIERESVAGPKS